ncbi:MAG: formate--tetrahydrofolate ligase, partial [Oscillospiraceae bacterium]
KCRYAGISPDTIVLVATIRALKYNGGIKKEDCATPNIEALTKGLVNLEAHIENMQKFGVPVVVSINRFAADSDDEIALLSDFCQKKGADFALSEVFAKGGDGGIDLAEKVVAACEKPKNFHYIYDTNISLKEKIQTIAINIYGAKDVNYSPAAEKAIEEITDAGLDKLPVCIAKTQYSLSDDPKRLGRPTNFKIRASDVRLLNGAGFIVVEAGNIMTMPGLPKSPAACRIDVDSSGQISGLY